MTDLTPQALLRMIDEAVRRAVDYPLSRVNELDGRLSSLEHWQRSGTMAVWAVAKREDDEMKNRCFTLRDMAKSSIRVELPGEWIVQICETLIQKEGWTKP